jgi:hypothetical protein
MLNSATKVITSCIALLVFATAAFGYDYPIGIPPAWIEPDVARPTPPSPWNAEIPGYYYVNETAGIDTNRVYGTPSAPRKTIPNPVPAGSYVEVAGQYTKVSGGVTTITAAGTTGPWVANVSGPAWIVGASATSRATFTNILLLQGAGLCLEYCDNLVGNKRWQISSTTTGLSSGNYMLVRNCELNGAGVTNGEAFPINGNSASITRDIVVYNNVIHGFGPPLVETPPVDRDYVGVFAHNFSERIWVLDNHIYEMAGSGVAVSTQTAGPPTNSHIFVGRNHVHHTWAVGINTKTANHVVFSENHVHHTIYTPWSDAKGIGGQYSVINWWILYNHVHDCDYGIRMGSTGTEDERIYVIGNVIHDIRAAPAATYGGGAFAPAAIALWGSDHRFVLNNTIHRADRGIVMPSGRLPPDGIVIENNIVSDITNDHLFIENNFAGAVVRKNVFYQPNGNAILRYGSTARTVATFESAALGVGNQISDPVFRDVAAANYGLQSNSPARRVGLLPAELTENLYSTYLSQFSSIILPPSFSITTGPKQSAWDIGAVQSGPAPSNLTVE